MNDFDLCIGIDYSGAQTSTSWLKGLQVYAAQPGGDTAKVVQSSALEQRAAMQLDARRNRAPLA